MMNKLTSAQLLYITFLITSIAGLEAPHQESHKCPKSFHDSFPFREGLKKWEFSKRGWGGLPIWAPFLFFFKHSLNLNHPEMQRNFVHPLVTPGELVNLGR